MSRKFSRRIRSPSWELQPTPLVRADAVLVLASQGIRAINNVIVQAKESQLKPVGYPQFVVDLAQIILYYLLGRTHPYGNLLILHTLGDAADNNGLTWGEFNL